ncbi:hypothetical protein Tco_0765265 [Tanacetum coccineum]
MSIQDMEDLKQHYLDEILSLSNDLQIKDYRNEKIDIRFRRESENMIDELKGKFSGMSIEINKKKELQQLEQADKLNIISELPLSVAITPDSPITDSFIMGDEALSTIPEKESDEFIKSSVEDLVPIPSESKDTSESDNDCDLPSCDDFSPINVSEEKFVTFYNPLFDSNDDFTSSDDESLSDEDVSEDKFKIYSNPLFEFDDEYISSDVTLFRVNEMSCFDPGGVIDEIDALIYIDISTDIEDGYHDSEGDILYLESLLSNDTILSLPPKVFLDHDPRSLSDINDLKINVKDCRIMNESRARGFVHHSLDLQS